MRLGVVAVAVISIAAAPSFAGAAARGPLIVTTRPAFFNPALGRVGTIRVESGEKGTATIEILDRDRYVVRRLAPLDFVGAAAAVDWNGRDDLDRVVPDEAYSVRVTFVSTAGRRRIFDPGAEAQPEPQSIDKFSYSRIDGVLNYKLPSASRVHIQAGQARKGPDGIVDGPILRTVVDRSPRSGGAVSEQFSGFDESRKIYIPDLPNFVVAILASPLPEATLITIGNRKQTFLEYASLRNGMERRAARGHVAGAASHHVGIAGIEDRSPRVALSHPGSEGDSRWQLDAHQPIEFRAAIPEELSSLYLGSGSKLLVFRDLERIGTVECRENPCAVRLAGEAVPSGSHRLAVNWDSGRGPVGVGVVTVERR